MNGGSLLEDLSPDYRAPTITQKPSTSNHITIISDVVHWTAGSWSICL